MSSSSSVQSLFIRRLYLCSWVLVAYTVLVVVWGAWVRISGSGDGCGDHWPLCHGQVIPLQQKTKTWVEFSHRLSTALYGLFVLAQLVAVRRCTPPRHPARRWSVLVLLFTITEALIGRELVKAGLVTDSLALARLFVMPLHLVNTALLLACAVVTAESIRFGDLPRTPLPRALRVAAGIVCAVLILLLTSGAVAALGSHLAPAASVGAGLAADFSATAHPAVRLRILHPILALLGGISLLFPIELLRERTSAPRARRALTQLAISVAVALLVGIATLLSLAPVWLKLSHLLLANVLVILTSVSIFHLTRATDPSHAAAPPNTPIPQDRA